MSRQSLTLMALLALAPTLAAQAPLPVGSTTLGRFGASGEAARYTFTASAPGVLTVVVHGEEDLTLAVMDEDGQILTDGTADRDLGGQVGAEVLAVVLGEPGNYRVEVRSYSDKAGSFRIGATFVTMPGFARSPDPDGRPSLARPLAIGAAHTDQVHPDEGDQWDWYTVTVTEASTLVLLTRVEEGIDGDLALEVYLDRDFETPAAQSDQDLQGNLGNESVTVDVRAGQAVHVKVRSYSTSGDAVPYRVSVTRVP